MKKRKIIFTCITCIILLALSGALILFKQTTLKGKWIITEFNTDNNTVPFEQIKKYYGEQTYEAYKYYTLFFDKDFVTISIPTYTDDKYKSINCKYSIKNGYIYIENNNEKIQALKIQDKKLINVNLPGFEVIWEKSK